MQNEAQQQTESEYYTRVKPWVLAVIREGPNAVLDLGCASGRLGRKLLEQGKAKVLVGAEIFPAAAQEAAQAYDKVFTGDIEETELDYTEYFDYVVCGDILEHLKDPYKMVGKIHTWLKPGGSILACLPNVRNYRVVGDLVLRGRWEYESSGILDRTHLRFFTRASCRELLEGASLEIFHEQLIISGPKKNLFNRLTFGLFGEFLATQVFCCARKPVPGCGAVAR
jgi:O-antigen biosynthesis protein